MMAAPSFSTGTLREIFAEALKKSRAQIPEEDFFFRLSGALDRIAKTYREEQAATMMERTETIGKMRQLIHVQMAKCAGRKQDTALLQILSGALTRAQPALFYPLRVIRQFQRGNASWHAPATEIALEVTIVLRATKSPFGASESGAFTKIVCQLLEKACGCRVTHAAMAKVLRPLMLHDSFFTRQRLEKSKRNIGRR
jgi:hypothetical protein